MFREWRNKRRKWKNTVREKSEEATARFLTKIFMKFGVEDAAKRFLCWAETHRKTMFTITVSFLIFVLCFSIIIRPDMSCSEVYREKKEEANVKDKPIFNNRGLKDLMEIVRLKDEISSIGSDGKLTAEDSVKIKEIYNKLKNQ